MSGAALDMTLDDLIKNNKKSGGGGIGCRRSSGPGPTRRFSIRSSNRSAPYSSSKVHLELLYCPFGMKNGFTNPFAPDFSMTSLEKVLNSGEENLDSAENGNDVKHRRREVITRGVLSVTVISADDLAPADLMGKADPYVVVTMKKTEAKNKTRVANGNLNPDWNQTFDVVVEDGLHDILILEVWDHDTFGKDFMGRCILTVDTYKGDTGRGIQRQLST